MIRKEHGTDIDAACGQLRSKQMKKQLPNNRILLVFSITIKGAVFLIKELFNLNKRKDSIAKAIKLLTKKTLINKEMSSI